MSDLCISKDGIKRVLRYPFDVVSSPEVLEELGRQLMRAAADLRERGASYGVCAIHAPGFSNPPVPGRSKEWIE